MKPCPTGACHAGPANECSAGAAADFALKPRWTRLIGLPVAVEENRLKFTIRIENFILGLPQVWLAWVAEEMCAPKEKPVRRCSGRRQDMNCRRTTRTWLFTGKATFRCRMT